MKNWFRLSVLAVLGFALRALSLSTSLVSRWERVVCHWSYLLSGPTGNVRVYRVSESGAMYLWDNSLQRYVKLEDPQPVLTKPVVIGNENSTSPSSESNGKPSSRR